MNVILRRIVSLCLAAALLCAVAFAQEERALKTISSPADAEAFTQLLLGGEAASLDGAYRLTDAMDRAVAGMGGFQGLALQLAGLGPLKEICPAFETETNGLRAYRVPCRFWLFSVDLVYTMDGDALAGLVTAHFTEPAEQKDAGSAAFTETALALPVPSLNGELPGTLTLPKGDGPFPAVVLVHGSGPSDRDETVGALTPFRDIAGGLAQKGIAVYRFDKRTFVYGYALARDTHLTLMDETILDAVAAVQLLAAQERIDSERIFVLGHSLGGMAIPAIDRELKNAPVRARGYILMAPGAQRLDIMMRRQYEFLAGIQPEAVAQKDAVLAELDSLNDLDALPDDALIAGAYAPYWRWLAAYDILGVAAEIEAPCLLLQGEEDYQTTMDDYRRFEAACGGKGNWTFISYPGLVHLFIHGLKTDGSAAYMKDERVDPAVIDDLADFIIPPTAAK